MMKNDEKVTQTTKSDEKMIKNFKKMNETDENWSKNDEKKQLILIRRELKVNKMNNYPSIMV